MKIAVYSNICEECKAERTTYSVHVYINTRIYIGKNISKFNNTKPKNTPLPFIFCMKLR